MREAKRRADVAGHFRFGLPSEFGGKDGSNLWMTVIREHLATKGLGLHYDQQTEHSIVANNPFVVMLRDFASDEQKADSDPGPPGRHAAGHVRADRALPRLRRHQHGDPRRSGAAQRRPRLTASTARRCGRAGMHHATHCALFVRTSGKDGDARGITCFLVPADDPGVKVEQYMWTFNMPTDHPRVSFKDVWVPERRHPRRAGRPASRWRSRSCTRTASARPPARSARRSTASRRA